VPSGDKNHIPCSYIGTHGTVLAASLPTRALKAEPDSDDSTYPFVSMLFRADDGTLITGEVTRMVASITVELEADHKARIAQIDSNLGRLVGTRVFAMADTDLYESNTPLADLTDQNRREGHRLRFSRDLSPSRSLRISTWSSRISYSLG
jgi:hypothetical protein